MESEGLDFKETCREIRALVANGLEGKEKDRNDEEYIQKLGGKGRKRPKMAYPVYMNMLKNKKKRQQKEKDDMVTEWVVLSFSLSKSSQLNW